MLHFNKVTDQKHCNFTNKKIPHWLFFLIIFLEFPGQLIFQQVSDVPIASSFYSENVYTDQLLSHTHVTFWEKCISLNILRFDRIQFLYVNVNRAQIKIGKNFA